MSGAAAVIHTAAPRSPTTTAPRVRLALLLTASLLLALAVRLPAFLASDFPLNDGGMFFSMVEDLRASDFRLPAYTSYNGGSIPFVYPPLGFYATALVADVSGADSLTLVRWLPLLVNLGCVVAFALLAHRALSGRAAALAILFFPLFPFSFEWVTMGGGVARSFGLLFATLALAVAVRPRPTAADIAAAAALTGGAVLSHPEAGLFTVVAVGVAGFTSARVARGLRWVAAVWVGAALAASPWWLTSLLRHGLDPFLAVRGATEWSWSNVEALAAFFFTAEPLLTVFGVLAVIGLFFEISSRRWLLPLLVPLTVLVVPRSAHTPLALLLALLAGIAVADVIQPRLSRPETGSRLAATLFAVWVIGYGLLSCWMRFSLGRQDLIALHADERSAMRWVAARTEENARFLVVTAAASWASDPASEWFPALTSRHSLTTPQGFEWVGGTDYRERQALYAATKRWAATGSPSLARPEWTHIWVSKASRGPHDVRPLIDRLRASPATTLLYDGAGAAVFARTPGR